jgi:hypothetical protein
MRRSLAGVFNPPGESAIYVVGRYCKNPTGFDSRLRIDNTTWNILNNDGRPAPMLHQDDRCDVPQYHWRVHYRNTMSKCPDVARKLKAVRDMNPDELKGDYNDLVFPPEEFTTKGR